MTEMQWFAFGILPAIVGAVGALAAKIGTRFIP